MVEKSCYNCQKYPLCRAMTDIVKIIDRDCIFNSDFNIKKSLAKECKAYKFSEVD